MSDSLLKIEIVTPRNTAYSATAQAITLPGTLGPFQVLVQHAPIISSLELGMIKVIDAEGNDVIFATHGGFAEVKDNVVSIVVESAESAGDINYDEAVASLAQMEERIATMDSGSVKDEEKRLLHRAKNRVRVSEAYRELL